MSLFICDKCYAIENHCCLRPKNKEPKPNYPNMHLMDMQGHGDDIYLLDDTGAPTLFKEKKEIMMLCSECNTGHWHDEFEKAIVEGNSSEKYVSRLSLHRYITPSNHIDDLTYGSGPLGEVELKSEKTKTLIDWITMGYRKCYNTYEDNIVVMSKNDIRVDWLLKVYIENVDSFDFTVIDGLFEECIPGGGMYHFNLFIRDCLSEEAYEQSNVMSTIREFLEYNKNKPYSDIVDEYIDFERYVVIKKSMTDDSNLSFETRMMNAINRVIGAEVYTQDTELARLKNIADRIASSKYKQIKPHWKNKQSDEERDEKLRKANEKRLRKQDKKQSNAK